MRESSSSRKSNGKRLPLSQRESGPRAFDQNCAQRGSSRPAAHHSRNPTSASSPPSLNAAYTRIQGRWKTNHTDPVTDDPTRQPATDQQDPEDTYSTMEAALS